MRGWISSSALFMLLLAVPLWAQRGGGGAHGGMGGGHVGGGHVAGGFSGGARGGTGYAYHANRGYAGYSNGNAYRGWGGNAWRGNNWNGHGWYGRGWYGNRWVWGYPYWGWGVGWYPGWNWGFYGDTGYDSSYSYSPDMSTYTAAPTNAPSYPSVVYMTPDGTLQDAPSSETQEQISQLQSQVAQLQAQQKSSSPKVTEVHYDTVLVYRDGHSETVGNYAITGNTLWVFNETRARKIPLSELDIAATKRDNQERGNDFVVPGSR
jgi:hypothetical protein